MYLAQEALRVRLARPATDSRTATDVLNGILDRDGAQLSAHTEQRTSEAAATTLARNVAAWQDAVSVAAEARAGPRVATTHAVADRDEKPLQQGVLSNRDLVQVAGRCPAVVGLALDRGARPRRAAEIEFRGECLV